MVRRLSCLAIWDWVGFSFFFGDIAMDKIIEAVAEAIIDWIESEF